MQIKLNELIVHFKDANASSFSPNSVKSNKIKCTLKMARCMISGSARIQNKSRTSGKLGNYHEKMHIEEVAKLKSMRIKTTPDQRKARDYHTKCTSLE